MHNSTVSVITPAPQFRRQNVSMPKLSIYESRRLVLPLETVVDAVLEFDRERGGRLSMAAITDARIETGANPELLLEVRYPDSPQANERRYSLPAIAAALIHYLWKAKVPLPRGASKSIEIVPEGFALMLQGTVELNRRHAGFATRARSEAGNCEAAAAAEPAAGRLSR